MTGDSTASPAIQSERIAPVGKLDLSTVAEFHAQLTATSQPRVDLDLGGVTHFGALALQVVMAAGEACRARGSCLRVINASDRLLAQMSAMGVTPETLMEGHR